MSLGIEHFLLCLVPVNIFFSKIKLATFNIVIPPILYIYIYIYIYNYEH